MLNKGLRLTTCLVASFFAIVFPLQSAESWTTIPADNLSQWSDPGKWWRAESGTFIAESKGGNALPKVHYLAWNGTTGKDVEITLEYRIHARQPRDAGINFRVEKGPHQGLFNLPSYQAELDTANMYGKQKPIREGKLFGHIHDGKRSHMFKRNLVSTASSNGKITTRPLRGKFCDPSRVFRKPPAWNQCRIVARGAHVLLYFNGDLANEIYDNDLKARPDGDGIALQFRPKDAYKFEVRALKFRTPAKEEISLQPTAGETIESLAIAGRLDQAIALYEKQYASKPAAMESLDGLKLAVLYIANGDIQKHRDLCQRLFKQYTSFELVQDAERTAKAYLLVHPSYEKDLLKIADQRSLHAIQDKSGKFRAWIQVSRGMAHYRMGKYDLAKKLLTPGTRNRNPWLQISAKTFTAMANFKLGTTDQALKLLREAETLLNKTEMTAGNWNDALTAKIGISEAKKLIYP